MESFNNDMKVTVQGLNNPVPAAKCGEQAGPQSSLSTDCKIPIPIPATKFGEQAGQQSSLAIDCKNSMEVGNLASMEFINTSDSGVNGGYAKGKEKQDTENSDPGGRLRRTPPYMTGTESEISGSQDTNEANVMGRPMTLLMQINLHRSKLATQTLMEQLRKGKIHIVLIQEPWTIGHKVAGLNDQNFQLFYARTGTRPRTCILCHKNINFLFSTQLSSADATVLQHGSQKLLMASLYLPSDSPKLPPSSELSEITKAAKSAGKEILIGCDANSQHISWGSTKCNKRGDALLEFLNANDLFTLNTGNTATFVNRLREEVIDITFCSEGIIDEVYEWRVLDTHSFSDHRYICFGLSHPPPEPILFRNKAKTDWSKFRLNLQAHLDTPTEFFGGTEDIDRKVDELTGHLVKSFEGSCPLRERKSPREKPWLTGELVNLGKEVRRLFNRARRKKRSVYWDDYHSKLRLYNGKIRTAKRNSWRLFCGQVDSVNDVSKIKKFLSKTHTQPETLIDGNGIRADSVGDSLRILMDTHFLGDNAGTDTEQQVGPDVEQQIGPSVVQQAVPDGGRSVGTSLEQQGSPNGGQNRPWSGFGRGIDITGEMVRMAVASFSPFKAAGPDGVFPALLQQSIELIDVHLASIFSACLRCAYTPRQWQEAKVVFIPKPGKESYANPKAYRPISLTSFLLKTMERIVDNMVKDQIPSELLRFKQHAYLRGRSVETALHEVVYHIERSLDQRVYTLAVFIDIEGAFNNVLTETLIRSLDQFDIDRALVDWISHMLGNRWINCEVNGISLRDRVCRGIPQGGILSPLLWVITINSLLRILTSEGFQPVCYADDVAILLRGTNPRRLSRRASEALELSYNWARPRGLNVNPEKTEICLFTRRTKIISYDKPRFLGKTINISETVKYLGVILDKKLYWKEHIESRITKAHRAWATCRRAIGSKWGLNPKMTHWLYTSVIRPILTYAAVVWWTSMRRKCNINPLQRIQRLCCLGISGAIRTTSTRALETILSIEPIEIRIKYEAALAMLRLNATNEWICGDTETNHQRILDELPGYTITELNCDRISERSIAARCDTRIPSRESWRQGTFVGENTGVHFFTDGSKVDGRTGLGFYSRDLAVGKCFRLPDHNTVIQAEIRAITECIRFLNVEGIAGNIRIFTDSQSAIRAISSKYVRSATVLECVEEINNFSIGGSIEIIWVPGHCDIAGNEKADKLAREGSSLATVNLEGTKPFQAFRAELQEWTVTAHGMVWDNAGVAEATRILWGGPDRSVTREILKLGKGELGKIIGILTGHSALGVHLFRMGHADSGICRACEEDDGTLEHYLCVCPAFSSIRVRHLGGENFSTLRDLNGVGWRRLRNFVNETDFLQ